MDTSSFLSSLRAFEQNILVSNYRLLPAAFEPTKELTAYPVPLERGWPSLTPHMRVWDSRGLMARVPLFWQMEAPLRTTCDEVGAFLFINDMSNMPLGAAAIRDANVDTVVTQMRDVGPFSLHLLEAKIALPNFIAVHPHASALAPLPQACRETPIAQEVHLFPGVPMLVQCPCLSAQKEPVFHAAPGCRIYRAGGQVLFTGADTDPQPPYDYPLLMTLREAGSCQCGEGRWAYIDHA